MKPLVAVYSSTYRQEKKVRDKLLFSGYFHCFMQESTQYRTYVVAVVEALDGSVNTYTLDEIDFLHKQE